MNIIFITSRLPYPPIGGDRLRAYHIIRELARKHDIYLLALADRAPAPGHLAALRHLVKRLDVVVLPWYQSYFNAARGLLSPQPLQVHYYASSAMRQAIVRLRQHYEIDAAYVHLIRMAGYSEALQGLPKILDLTDSYSMLYESYHKFNSRARHPLHRIAQAVERRRMLAYERQMIRTFDTSLVISPIDLSYLRRQNAHGRLAVVGPAVNLDYFRFHRGDYDPRRIVFLGKMNYLPNVDAVLYFHRHIFPLIAAEVPDIRFRIIGTDPDPAIERLTSDPRITVSGFLPDIRPSLQQAALSICPMRMGAGIKNKVLEAMAAGTPVVSTTFGASGLNVRHGENILLADTPEAFAANVVRLLRDPAKRRHLAFQGRILMERHYSWHRLGRQLERNLALITGSAMPAHEKRNTMHDIARHPVLFFDETQ